MNKYGKIKLIPFTFILFYFANCFSGDKLFQKEKTEKDNKTSVDESFIGLSIGSDKKVVFDKIKIKFVKVNDSVYEYNDAKKSIRLTFVNNKLYTIGIAYSIPIEKLAEQFKVQFKNLENKYGPLWPDPETPHGWYVELENVRISYCADIDSSLLMFLCSPK